MEILKVKLQAYTVGTERPLAPAVLIGLAVAGGALLAYRDCCGQLDNVEARTTSIKGETDA